MRNGVEDGTGRCESERTQRHLELWLITQHSRHPFPPSPVPTSPPLRCLCEGEVKSYRGCAGGAIATITSSCSRGTSSPAQGERRWEARGEKAPERRILSLPSRTRRPVSFPPPPLPATSVSPTTLPRPSDTFRDRAHVVPFRRGRARVRNRSPCTCTRPSCTCSLPCICGRSGRNGVSGAGKKRRSNTC